HARIELETKKFADSPHVEVWILDHLLVLYFMHGYASTYQDVPPALHFPITDHGSIQNAGLGEERRSGARPHDAAADVSQVSPNDDEACVGKLPRQLRQAVVVVGRLLAPHRSRACILLPYSGRAGGKIGNGDWNSGFADVMPRKSGIPKLPTLPPFGAAALPREQRLQQVQIGLVHESDLGMLVQQAVKQGGSGPPHAYNDQRSGPRVSGCETFPFHFH